MMSSLWKRSCTAAILRPRDSSSSSARKSSARCGSSMRPSVFTGNSTRNPPVQERTRRWRHPRCRLLHCVDVASCRGHRYWQVVAEPIEVKGCGHFAPSGVDTWATASLKFPDDILAALASSVEVQQENTLRILGSNGSIFVPARGRRSTMGRRPGYSSSARVNRNRSLSWN